MRGEPGGTGSPDLITRTVATPELFAFTDDVAAKCPRKQTRNDYDACGAMFLDLPKVPCGGDRSGPIHIVR